MIHRTGSAQTRSNGGRIDLYTCNGGPNQQWTLRPNGEIAGLQSGRCLDDPGFSTTNGTGAGHLVLQRRHQPAVETALSR